jgi:hypothetical protein
LRVALASGCRKLALLPALIAMTLAMAPTAASAHGVRGDDASASVYIRARHALMAAALASVPSARKSGSAYVKGVGAECPDVLSGAPSGPQLSALMLEEVNAVNAVVSAVVIAGSHPAAIAFLRATAHLRWSTPKLGRTIRRQGGVNDDEAPEAVPALCADDRAWVASGYKTLSPATQALARSEAGAKPGTPRDVEALWHALRSHETRATAKLARETEKLETSYVNQYLDALIGAGTELRALLGPPG